MIFVIIRIISALVRIVPASTVLGMIAWVVWKQNKRKSGDKSNDNL